MKSLITILLILGTCTVTTAQKGSWSSWQETDCLQNLEFRVQRGDYNSYAKKYKWYVEFRNLSGLDLHFNMVMVPSDEEEAIRTSGKTTDRKHALSNSSTTASWFLVDDASRVYVHINKIRQGAEDYGSEYIECDK